MNIEDYDSLFRLVDDVCTGCKNWYNKTLITTSGIRKRNINSAKCACQK